MENLVTVVANEVMSSNSVELPDGWKTFICSEENIRRVWELFQQFPILFDDLVREDYDSFRVELMDLSSIVLATGDYGLVRIANIRPGRDADIHLTFWDRRFKGRDKECKQALFWLFDRMELQRVTIMLPAIVFATIRFTEAMGFRREGVLRKAFMYKGDFLDVHLFGILREDVIGKEENNG